MMKKVEIALPNAVNFFRAANPIEIPPHLVMAISNSPESSVFSSCGSLYLKDTVLLLKGGHFDGVTLLLESVRIGSDAGYWLSIVLEHRRAQKTILIGHN